MRAYEVDAVRLAQSSFPTDSHPGPRRYGYFRLFLGFSCTFLFVLALHWLSPKAPGAVGETFRQNRVEKIAVDALVYTESGPVSDYLDSERGKYARVEFDPDLD